MDQQTDVRRSAGFAALVQALVSHAASAPAAPYDRDLYARAAGRARRVDPPRARASSPLVVEPASARELGTLGARRRCCAPPEAERQLEVGARPARRPRTSSDRSLA